MRCTVREGCLYLEGAVTVHTVTPSVFGQFAEQCARSDVGVIDLHGVSQADSACAALLLVAMRRRAAPPVLKGLPAAVRELAALYEISEWIPAWTPDTPAPLSFSHSA